MNTEFPFLLTTASSLRDFVLCLWVLMFSLPRRAGGAGRPGVVWDAAVDWRWAREFEQPRVCVSEAPPPPRLLGARGARREREAAAPAARVGVSAGAPG